MRTRELGFEPLERRLLLSAASGSDNFGAGQFEPFADASETTPGLIGSYVNRSLRSYATQDDWRATQVISGTRTDASIDFDTGTWGSRVSVGVTGGSDANWDNFSVQWDGYVRIDQACSLAIRSDDSSRMWIDINNDGTFDSSGLEFIDNNWGTEQATTTSSPSQLLSPGVYKIRIQYEQDYWGAIMQIVSVPPPEVHVAYIIPSNRTEQPDMVANLQYSVELWQNWYRDQMDRNGFGPKTFAYETEPDDTTPLIHVVHVNQTDDYLRGDLWGRAGQAAADAGIPLWSSGQIWLLVLETHVESSDGTVQGGVALGGGGGSGMGGGVAMIGANGMTFTSQANLVNNTAYDGLVIPGIGSYPLDQDVSFPWFEGSTLSTLASTYLGAALHELTHAFGMPHDFRNDGNDHGDLMGNGLRGMRGAVYPQFYPNDDCVLSYGQALALSTSRYFNPFESGAETNPPKVSVATSGAIAPSDGLLAVTFSASDATGLSCAILQDNDGNQIAEMQLSGTSVTATFETPYYTPGASTNFTVAVYDLYGNCTGIKTQITPATGYNAAPRPYISLSTSTPTVGQAVVLNASGTTDADDPSSSLTVEWDIDGDGVFDTAPNKTTTYTITPSQIGEHLIRARVTDPHGAQSVSEPLAIRVLSGPATNVPPIAELTNPGIGSIVDAGQLNIHGYIDVSIRGLSGVGLEQTTILDSDPEFTLGGEGSGSVVVEGVPTVIDGNTYRYHFTGVFSAGTVYVNMIQGSFADAIGNANLAETRSFTVTRSDATPPTPDPSTWTTLPYATGTTSISMTATTASDPNGVQYFFHCLTSGGHDSGWQRNPTYQDTGLSPNTTYVYQVMTRDQSPAQNQGSYSASASATTNMAGPAVFDVQVTAKTSADKTTITWKASDASGLGPATLTLTANGKSTTTNYKKQKGTQASYSYSGKLAAGDYSFTIAANNGKGESRSCIGTFTVDATPPIILKTSSKAGASDKATTIKWTVADIDKIQSSTLYIDDAAVTSGVKQSGKSTLLSYTYTAFLAAGVHNFKIRAVDASFQSASTTSDEHWVTVKATVPTIKNVKITGKTSAVFTAFGWNAYDFDGIQYATISIDGGTPVTVVPNAGSTATTASYLYSVALTSGKHSYALTVYDAQSSSKTVNGKFTVKLARLANAIAKQSAGLTRRLPAAAEAADGTAKTEWMIDYGSTSDAADNDVLDAVFAGY